MSDVISDLSFPVRTRTGPAIYPGQDIAANADQISETATHKILTSDERTGLGVLVGTAINYLPPTDDGMEVLEYSQLGRVQLGRKLDGTLFNPDYELALPPTDDGLDIIIASRISDTSYNAVFVQQIDGLPYVPKEELYYVPPTDDGVELIIAQQVAVSSFSLVAATYIDGSSYPAVIKPIEYDTIYPNDPRLSYQGYTRLVESDAEGTILARPANPDSPGQQYDMPGARLVFQTEATSIVAQLTTKGTVEGNVTSHYNPPSVAEMVVDGTSVATASTTDESTGDTLLTITATGLAPTLKTIELLPPIERPASFGKIYIARGAGLAGQIAQSAKLLVLTGDSNTAGQGTSKRSATWSYQLQRARGCRLYNHGYPSRQSVSGDGTRDGSFLPDAGIMMIGTNDFLLGEQNQNRSLSDAVSNFEAMVDGWLTSNSKTAAPLLVISPIICAVETPQSGWSRSDWALPDLRAAQHDFVTAHTGYGSRLFFQDGYGIVTTAQLKDGVHMTDAGHATFFAAVNAALPNF